MDFKDSTGSIRRQALKQKIKVSFLNISQPADVKKRDSGKTVRQVSSRICHRISHQAGSGFHKRGMLLRVQVPKGLRERSETGC